MSDKTKNQLILNEKLTELLNKNTSITNFNIFVIDLLAKRLESIHWEDKFSAPQYWFFVKGGTALRLIFESTNQLSLMPAESDWDTQIVINPDYDFALWYEAYNKIQAVVNEVLVMANMAFTLLPGLSNTVKTDFPEACNELPIIEDTWNGEVKYRQSADRETSYLYSVFHPLQPGDTGRRLFAYLPQKAWNDSGETGSLFDQLYPRETIEFNQQQYRELATWKATYGLLTAFIDATKWGFTPDQQKEFENNFNFYRWSMERITDLNKDDAISWSNSYFGTSMNESTTKAQVRQTLTQQYNDSERKTTLLASGQRTLIIDEFYLFRLMVRFKYQKPVKLADGKTQADYIDAWSASGNLRGELIDVTIPRRDTYEAKHHGVLLGNGTWQVIQIQKSISDAADSKSVAIPVLSNEYQISEQVLIVREILAGTSSSPNKIKKRLQRGYALANGGLNTDEGRSIARKTLNDLINQQFRDTYALFANDTVNELISATKQQIDDWSNHTIRSTDLDTLNSSFDKQAALSAGNLQKTGLDERQLNNLTTFVDDVTDTKNYEIVWEDTIGQTNAGMLDFFIIATIYAFVAHQIQILLTGLNWDLSIHKPRQPSDPREVIKGFCTVLANYENFYPQVAGRAASYFHIKTLEEVFKQSANTILVDAIEINAIRLFPGPYGYLDLHKVVKQTLLKAGEELLLGGRITEYSVKYNAKPVPIYQLIVNAKLPGNSSKIQTFMRVRLISKAEWLQTEYQTEYAYGIPVISLDKLISNLRYQIGASEFLQSEKVRAELTTLQQALTIREFSALSQDSNIPPLKRSLSSSDLKVLTK